MSRDLALGLFPQEVIDAYNMELNSADEADEIAAKIVNDPHYDWGSDESVRSPGVPTSTSSKKTRPIRSIAIRNLDNK